MVRFCKGNGLMEGVVSSLEAPTRQPKSRTLDIAIHVIHIQSTEMRTLNTIIQIFSTPTQRTLRLLVRQVDIHETEVGLAQKRPPAFPIKVRILSLLVLVRDRLWLRVALEPCQILFVESP
jgi:hypothetical protein